MSGASSFAWSAIRPGRSLLLATGLFIVPLCGLIGWGAGSSAAWILGIALTLVAAGFDAVRGTRSVRHWTIDAPESLRLFQNRPTQFRVKMENRDGRAHKVSVHVQFPIGMECVEDVATVDLAGAAHIAFDCLPLERGEFHIESSSMQFSSPWSLWHLTGSAVIRTTVRVYPDLRKEREGNFLIARQSAGQHQFRQNGKGREFEKLREYAPGDSFEDIHWKATARRRRPVVKVFQIERTQEVYAVIDASRLSARKGLMDRYVSAALTLALAAEAQHDRFGLVSFSAGVDSFLPAASGTRHFGACREAIYALQSRPVTADLEDVFSVLRTRVRKRSLIVFLTTLDDPALAESFARNIHVLSRSHLVLVNVPDQEQVRPLFAGSVPNSVGDIYARLAGHLEWTQLHELKRTLERGNVHLAITNPAELPAQLTRQYFEVKQRQIL